MYSIICFSKFSSDRPINLILVNLENLNAQMIKDGIEQKIRLEKLNNIAKEQYTILQDNNSMKKIEVFDNSKIKRLK